MPTIRHRSVVGGEGKQSVRLYMIRSVRASGDLHHLTAVTTRGSAMRHWPRAPHSNLHVDSRGTGRDATLGLAVELRGAPLCKYPLTRNKETAHNEREVMSTIDSINRRSTPMHCSYVMTLLLDPGPRPVYSQVRGEWRSFIQRGSEGAYLRPTIRRRCLDVCHREPRRGPDLGKPRPGEYCHP